MYIYDKKAIHQCDNNALEEGMSIFTLMENAGRGLFEAIKSLITKEMRIIILAGQGNNGGDGVVLARYLMQDNYQVSLVFPIGKPITEASNQHLAYFQNQKFMVTEWNKDYQYHIVIDCLLGIGARMPLSDELIDVISWANKLETLKIAVDIPTGTLADRGNVDCAFMADYTFCLHGMKPSAFLLPSSEYYGELREVNIGLKHKSNLRIVQKNDVIESFPKRGRASHKGTFGTSLLIAGSDEMPGSALLSAIGAVRSGTGKLVIATSSLAAQIIAQRVPEATYLFDGLEKIAKGYFQEKVIAAGIGPGISDKVTASEALLKLVELNIPIVIDAGALDASLDFQKLKSRGKGQIIITPHPGEFSRLTKLSVKDIQENRIRLTEKFARENNITVVLKGHYTVIAFPDGETFINPTGNSGLAKGGSGDVLTGIMVSMLATHQDYRSAVKNAVYIHGLCADIWKESYSETSMVSSDFYNLLPQALRQIERS